MTLPRVASGELRGTEARLWKVEKWVGNEEVEIASIDSTLKKLLSAKGRGEGKGVEERGRENLEGP